MTDLISNGESEVKEDPVDYMGVIKFAGWAVVGMLTILGLTWLDLFDMGDSAGKGKKSQSESKKDEDSQADYEKEYLDEEISEEALDEHETGIS
tara:strand:- start:324 stop:605 length:282 start_codon:yes stop_codon:yes gene_type:complete